MMYRIHFTDEVEYIDWMIPPRFSITKGTLFHDLDVAIRNITEHYDELRDCLWNEAPHMAFITDTAVCMGHTYDLHNVFVCKIGETT